MASTASNSYHLGPLKAYRLFWKRYFSFKALSNRKEFWWPFLINWIVRIVLMIGCLLEMGNHAVLWTLVGVLILYNLAALVPSVSLTFRRYRDAGFSGWWLLYTDLMFYIFKLVSIDSSLGPIISDLCNLLMFSCVVVGLILAIMPTKAKLD